MQKRFSIFMAISLLCLGLLAPLGVMAKNYNLLGGQAGATWRIIVSAYANALSKASEGKDDVTVLLGSGLSNPIRLNRGDADVAIATGSAVWQAREGKGPYKQKQDNIAAMASLCDDMNLQIVVPKDSQYQSIKQIVENKMPVRINHGIKGTGAEQLIREIFKFYGADWKDVNSWGGKVSANSFQDAAGLFKDGVIDMYIWNGPGELGLITEIAISHPLRWLPVDDETNEHMTKILGTKKGMLPASMYNNAVGVDTPSNADSQGLYVRKDMDEETVYKMTKAWVDNLEEMAFANPGLKKFSPEGIVSGLGAELHPGAAKYYRERGWLQ